MRFSGGFLLLLLLTPGGAAAEAPSAASPGEISRVTAVDDRCPTFSWSAVVDAEGYEVAVYRLGADGESPDPVLHKRLQGPVQSWTPSLDRCLERGGRYAWSVRAVGPKALSEWSVPSLFEVARGPSRAEFEHALGVVREYLAPGIDRADRQATPAAAQKTLEPGVSAPFEILGSEGAITVTGEVRTLAPDGAPRLWGRGRPGGVVYGQFGGFCSRNGIRFGLSQAVVDWGSAAEACPVGSWVCTKAERGLTACVTLRRGQWNASWMACDGTIQTPTDPDMLGWVADNTGTHYPEAIDEGGGPGPTATEACKGFAVWCCFE